MNTQERISALEAEVAKLKEVCNKTDIEGAKQFILDQLNSSMLTIKDDCQMWSDKDNAWLFFMNKKIKYFAYSYYRIYDVLVSDYNIKSNETNELVRSALCSVLELNEYTINREPILTSYGTHI